MSFSDKVVIVTGASNGIGRVIARTYARKGANVVLADIDEETGMKITSEIMENGGSAIFVKTDVRKEEDIQKLIDTTESNFKTIDIVINNAGKGMFKSPYDVTLEEWDDVINTNLRSVFLCSREAAKVMRRNKAGGAIVNIASTRAFMSEPYSEAYAATKGGIVSLTHALAASFSEDRITVNAISPGWIETGDYSQLRMVDHDQHFSKRVGKPDDIAGACLYLTSENNNFVTGTNLTIDGGMTRKMIYEE
jgi:NAD(P)-dependent dehydrogenase (short-subunit alcohol dehydrogenase family)